MTNEEKFHKLKNYCAKNKCPKCILCDEDVVCAWETSNYEIRWTEETEYAYNIVFGDDTQEAKADAGKPRVSLVPMQIVKDIAVIREYGVNKYKTVDNWKNVEVERYVDALGRHTLAFLNNPLGVDEESGYPHLWHIECNAAFLSELMKGEWK